VGRAVFSISSMALRAIRFCLSFLGFFCPPPLILLFFLVQVTGLSRSRFLRGSSGQ